MGKFLFRFAMVFAMLIILGFVSIFGWIAFMEHSPFYYLMAAVSFCFFIMSLALFVLSEEEDSNGST